MFHFQSYFDQRGITRVWPSVRFFLRKSLLSIVFAGVGLIAIAPDALAHHPLGGRSPVTFLEGFLSGVAHPMIGLDHFAFVIAVGLFAALMGRRGLVVPIGFAIASLVGTAIHLQRVDLPAPEFFIAASVVLFGILLGFKTPVNGFLVALFAIFAGVFHGYAYGEAIVGATMTPLVAYLSGFTVIQLIIAIFAMGLGHRTLIQQQQRPDIPIRFAGFLICGIGTAFLSSALLG